MKHFHFWCRSQCIYECVCVGVCGMEGCGPIVLTALSLSPWLMSCPGLWWLTAAWGCWLLQAGQVCWTVTRSPVRRCCMCPPRPTVWRWLMMWSGSHLCLLFGFGVIWPGVDDVIELILGAVWGNHNRKHWHSCECALIEDCFFLSEQTLSPNYKILYETVRVHPGKPPKTT